MRALAFARGAAVFTIIIEDNSAPKDDLLSIVPGSAYALFGRTHAIDMSQWGSELDADGV